MSYLPKDKKYTLYKHTSPSGKAYIGITSKPPSVRWGKDGKNYKNNAHFWAAIQKYGWENFYHEILAEGLSLDEACKLEREQIAALKSDSPKRGYNIAPGGEMPFVSEETKEKLRQRMKKWMGNPEHKESVRRKSQERWADPEFRAAHSGENAPRYGAHLSAESRKKISTSRKAKGYKPWTYGKTMPEEFRRKQSEIQRKRSPHRKHTDEEKEKIAASKRGARNPNFGKPMDPKVKAALRDCNCRPVKQMLAGILIETFESCKDASLSTGITASNINRCANGIRKTAGGFNWEFV